MPEVMSVKTYKEALEMAKDLDVVLVPYECAEGMDHTKKLIQSIKPDSLLEYLSDRKADLIRMRLCLHVRRAVRS